MLFPLVFFPSSGLLPRLRFWSFFFFSTADAKRLARLPWTVFAPDLLPSRMPAIPTCDEEELITGSSLVPAPLTMSVSSVFTSVEGDVSHLCKVFDLGKVSNSGLWFLTFVGLAIAWYAGSLVGVTTSSGAVVVLSESSLVGDSSEASRRRELVDSFFEGAFEGEFENILGGT